MNILTAQPSLISFNTVNDRYYYNTRNLHTAQKANVSVSIPQAVDTIVTVDLSGQLSINSNWFQYRKQ